ncbi:MAG: hypothetical protein IKT40_13555 [Bacilli bacterium]|nr:hypothetical protein [Bacilli bacterium]
MSRYKIKNLAIEISNRIDSPKTCGYDRFVGLEHYDSGEVLISRYGRTDNLDSSVKLFKNGDILIARRNVYLKRAGLVQFDGVTSGDSIVIRANDKTIQRLLPFVFNTKDFWDFANQFADGSMSKRLSPKILMEYETELPDTEEERLKLADLLWSIIETKNLYKEMIVMNDLLVKARFIELFEKSSKVVDFKDYVWFQEGPGVRSVDFRDSGTILLTGSNINDNKISFGYNSDRFISNELANGKYNHFMCKKDDILAVTSAISPNKFDEKIVVVEEDNIYCLNTGIIRFRPNTNFITRTYFKEFMKSDYFKNQVSENMRGVCQMHFGPSHLKKMKLLLPESLMVQNEFDDFVKKTENSIKSLKLGIEMLEKLYLKIIKQYLY